MNLFIGLRSIGLLSLIFITAGCYSDLEKQSWKEVKAVGEKYRMSSAAREQLLPNLAEQHTLNDFLAYALLQNASLEAEFNTWKAALEKITQVRTLPDPRFNYGYYIQEVETRVGAQKNSFGIAQTFPWYGTLLLKGGVALANAEAQKQRYEAEKLKIFNRVKEVYYEYYYLGRALDIIKKNLALFKELEQVSSEKYGTAEFTYANLIRIQIETIKFAERVDSLNDFRQPVLAKLRHVLNLNKTASIPAFPFPKKLNVVDIKPAMFKTLREQVKRNPKLKVLDSYIAREEKKRKIAWRRYIPDVTLGIDYIQTDKSSMKVKDNGKDPIIARIGLNLPIYFTKYEAERREAIARKMAFKGKRVDLEKLLLSDLEQYLFKMKDAKRKMRVYNDNLIPKAEDSLRAIQRSYVTGKTSYLDFIDAQQTLLKFQLVYEENLMNYAKAIARIEALTAKEIASPN
ncbi:MAG: TolC family protein [Victivallaceae bacterium]|nr:TolC family protein [Victivallaceae bacterium]